MVAGQETASRSGRTPVWAVALVVVLLAGGFAGFALYHLRGRPAAPAPSAAGRQGGDRRSRLADFLGLNETQRAQFAAISDETLAKLKALRANQSLPYQQRSEQLNAIRNEQTRKVEAILTPDQLAKWKARREEARAAARARGGKGGPPAAGGPGAPPEAGGAPAQGSPPAGKS